MSQSGAGAAGIKFGDDNSSTKLRSSTQRERKFRHSPYDGDIKHFPEFKDFVHEQRTTDNVEVISFLVNVDNDYDVPTKIKIPVPREPDELDIPIGADLETTVALKQQNLSALSAFEDKSIEVAKLHLTQDASYQQKKAVYNANKAKGWRWLRDFVSEVTLNTIIGRLDTDNPQVVFAELFKVDPEELKLSEGLEIRRKKFRFYAFYFEPRTQNSAAVTNYSRQDSLYQIEAKISDDDVRRNFVSQFSGLSYTAGDV